MSPSELSFTLRNDRSEIARMFALLEDYCRVNGISEDDMFNVRLVLDEAVINVIVHGKQPALQYLTIDEAVRHCTAGIAIWENLDEALRIVKLTRSYPPDARFRWNLEVMWPLDRKSTRLNSSHT